MVYGYRGSKWAGPMRVALGGEPFPSAVPGLPFLPLLVYFLLLEEPLCRQLPGIRGVGGKTVLRTDVAENALLLPAHLINALAVTG